MCASSGWATIGASTPSTSSSTAERSGAARSGCSSSSSVAASDGTGPSMPPGGRRTRERLGGLPALEQVADLGQQRHVLRRRLGRRLLVLLALREQPVQRADDEEEDDRGDDQERDDRVQEVAVPEDGLVDRELQAAEVRLTTDRRDQRRDDVGHQGGDDGAEGDAEHDRDGEIHDVAAQDELAKLL